MSDDLVTRAKGRLAFLVDRGEIKTPELIVEFIAHIEQDAATIARLEAALDEIAAEASVPVRTKKKGGIKHKWMYRGWRKIAVERIDIARAALKGADHD